MQYVEGTSLRSAIKPEGMDLVRAANIIRQVGRALSAAHKKGIYHRDLKPENIMLRPMSDGDEQVKVIDFGVAKVRNSSTLSSGIERTVGTISYMSPEQLSALPLGPASDVYSFGVMAYEMLTGRRPINPESIYQLLELQRSGVKVKPIDLRPRLTEAAQDILLKALAFDPKDRYQKVREFGDALAWALIADENTKPHTQFVTANFADPSWAISKEASENALIPTAMFQENAAGDLVSHQPQPSSVEQSSTATMTVRRQSFFSKHAALIRISLVAMALVVAGGLFVLNWKSKPLTGQPPENSERPASEIGPSAPEQTFDYWLTVQKIDKGKAVGPPFQSSGDQIFGTGWKFRFNLRPVQAGVLYLLNVGSGKNGTEEFNILFPIPLKNGEDAAIAAEQFTTKNWYEFDKKLGVEKLWIIWSDKPLPDLQEIFTTAARDKEHPGMITNSNHLSEMQAYLNRYSPEHTQVINDKSKKLTTVKGRGDVLVAPIELQHEAY
jgi:serine/threonine protein kinase